VPGRQEVILSMIDAGGLGLELGPSHAPLFPKSQGYRVHTLDHCSKDDLVARFRAEGLDVSRIEEVDFVWNGEPYAELTGHRHQYDWVVASHVVEHTTDLVGFLQDCSSILKDGGILALVVPDKRFCFDCLRATTSLAQVIDAHHAPSRSRHSKGALAEALLNVALRDGQNAWCDTDLPINRYRFVSNLEEATASQRDEQPFRDIHRWCFTPTSMRLLIQDLHDLGYSDLLECHFRAVGRGEFYVFLNRTGQGLSLSRLEALVRIRQEELIPTPVRS
jgi:predicted SAM-dependent methyltransferase